MADIEKTKATEAEKTEYAEPDMRPEKLIKQQEREAKMTPDELYAELKARLDKAFTAEEAAEIDKAFRKQAEALDEYRFIDLESEMDVMRDMLKADGLIDEETGDDPFADVLKPRGGQKPMASP